MADEKAALSGAYVRFSDHTRGRSPLYVDLAAKVAGDDAILCRLLVLPLVKRQPNLLFGAVKYLFDAPRDWPHFKNLVGAHWDEISALMLKRRTQTNEAARLATMLPLFASLPQPLALLEVGSSAGLCLLPDRYAFDYGGRRVAPSVDLGIAPPVFRCAANDATPIPERNVEIVWRAGLDLNPLDCRSEEDMRWLRALVWPGQSERERLLGEAIAIARADPPRVVKGDLTTDLAALAAEAPKDATLVISHSAVLFYVDPEGRRRFRRTVESLNAAWVCNEDPAVFAEDESWDEKPWPWGRDFLLRLNGKPVAHADSHGAAVDWLTPAERLVI